MSEIKLNKDFYPGIYDIIARGLFRKDFSKDLICIIYNALDLGNKISPEDIVFIDSNIINGVEFKTSELDVRFNITNSVNDIYADIEFQNYKKTDFLKRLVYYQSGQVVDSVEKGSLYNLEVLLVSICDFVVEPKMKHQDFVTILQRRDTKRLDGLKFDFDTMVIIQLPYLHKCDKMDLVKLFEIMKSDNPNKFKGDDALMDKVIDEIYFLNNNQETRLEIRLKEKAELDSKLALDYLKTEAKKVGYSEGVKEGKAEGHAEGKAEGHAEGHAEGLKEGHAAGVSEATLKIAKALKESNTPIDIIVSATKLSKEEVEKL